VVKLFIFDRIPLSLLSIEFFFPDKIMDETNAINKKEPVKGNTKEYKGFSNRVYFSCKMLV
jgi:hypothetical protein